MPRFKTNFDRIKETQQRYSKQNKGLQGEGSEMQFLSLKEGKNRVRVLPAWSSEGIWYLEVPYHYGLGEEKQAAICPKRFANKKCYICSKVKELRKEGGDAMKPLINKLRANTSIYYNVIDLDNPGKGVHIMRTGTTIFKDLLYYDLDEEDFGNITDPEKGYDVTIVRTGKTATDTKYTTNARKNPSKLEKMEWLDQLYDLDLLTRNVLTYSELKSLYEVDTSEDDDEEEEKETVSAKPEKKKVEVEVEEEEEEEEIVETKPSTKKKAVVAEEEDEDEDIEEVTETKQPKAKVVEEEGEEVTVPGCFSMDFDSDDDECIACDFTKQCEIKLKENKKSKKK